MNIFENPFYLLGAALQDGPQEIAALVAAHSPPAGGTATAEPASLAQVLTDPKQRIHAELGWLPGVDNKTVQQIRHDLTSNPQRLTQRADLSPLARASLLSAALPRIVEPGVDASRIADWILDLATAHAACDTNEIVTSLNLARESAQLAAITDAREVDTQLKDKRKHYHATLVEALNKTDASTLVEVMNIVVMRTTQSGTVSAPAIVDELVETFASESRDFFSAEAQNVHELISRVREATTVESNFQQIVEQVIQLVKVARNWGSVARPINMRVRRFGGRHEPSDEIAQELGELADELSSEYDLIGTAQRIIDVQAEMFGGLATAKQRRRLKP